MPQFSFSTAHEAHRFHSNRLADLRAQLDENTQRLGVPNLSGYLAGVNAPLLTEIALLEEKLRTLEATWEWEAENAHEENLRQVREQRALEQRRIDRRARKAAEIDAFDDRVNALHWDFVQVPNIVERRAIAMPFFEELERRAGNLDRITTLQAISEDLYAQLAAENGIDEAQIRAQIQSDIQKLQAQSGAFEVASVNPVTGKHFIVCRDEDGFTFVDFDAHGAIQHAGE